MPNDNTSSEVIVTSEENLKLKTPEALPVISTEKAEEMVEVSNIDPKINEQAENLIATTRIEDIDPHAPEFQEKLVQITNLGKSEAMITARVSNSILERKTLTESPAGKQVATSLSELRTTISDLDPNRADLSGLKKPLKLLNKLGGGKAIQHYFNKFESSQDKINAIVASLESGSYDLANDNKALNEEQFRLYDSMNRLKEAGQMLDVIDQSLQDRVDNLKREGKTEKAEALAANALYQVRLRRQDVSTELAVATQGYLSIGLLIENNDQLIKGVDRAKSTTVAALYTAVIVSQALTRQKLVLDQINAIRDTTSNMIEATSMQMRQQGAEINKKSSESMIDINKLKTAFNNIYATMDAVDSYKGEAVEAMKVTIDSLNTQIERSKTRVEDTQLKLEARNKDEYLQINR